MPTLADPENPNPEDLKNAIKQLQPTLPELLGPNYSMFEAELDSLLSDGNNDELFKLFIRYPPVFDRLQDILNHLTAGHGLYGDSLSDKPSLDYICPVGPHRVQQSRVRNSDVYGRPLCPVHGKPMTQAK